MSELAQEVVSIVETAGGSITYPELLAQISPEKHPRLRPALKEAFKVGGLNQKVEWDGSANTHTIFKVEGA
jgi:hypothetical protein